VWQERSPRRRLQGEKLASLRALDEWIPSIVSEPLRPRQRPLSPRERQLLRAQTIGWLNKGIIEPTTTQPLNNNLVFVAKKNGDVRVCNDCTPVNKVTEDYDWPLPRLQDIRHRLGKARFMSRLDLKDAFFRIRVAVRFRKYTAFTCDDIQYRFKRMPFGLKTAPAVFQQFMDTRLADLTGFCLWYIDDILVWGETLGELRRNTRIMKRRLSDMGCEVNEDKSEYERTALLFAGVWLFTEGQGPNLSKVRELLTLPVPTSKKDMQSALGLVSYLRDFAPLVGHFTAALYPNDSTPSLSGEQVQREWTKLMKHFASCVTTLRHWQEEMDADLYADASGQALGVIIIQSGKVVALSSRKLSPAETRYSATDREHLALVHAAKKFKVFLHRPIGVTRVYSDHAALLGRNWAEMTPRQARWAALVNQWIPRLIHVPGVRNPADFISRWGLEIFGGAMRL
jgi:hypothetical protein